MIKKIVKLFKFVVAWFRIPKGMYCYKVVHMFPKNHRYYWRATKHVLCPYWRKIEDRPDQENGWCDYLGKGDTELIKTKTSIISYVAPHFTDLKVGDEIEGISLLWDKCKECGINE